MIGNGAAGHQLGSGDRRASRRRRRSLPAGYTIAWTGQAFQEKRIGRTAILAFVFALVMVFLILSANYERWSLPAAVLLAVPFGLFGALTAVFLRNFSNDVYFQIGLVVLIGLAAKNAILIVEFAAQEQAKGLAPFEAALEAARLRFRPIVMTSLAFVLGVLPLVLASGAGAGARRSMGTGVFGGMLAATFIATLFIPLFFVLLSRTKAKTAAAPAAGAISRMRLQRLVCGVTAIALTGCMVGPNYQRPADSAADGVSGSNIFDHNDERPGARRLVDALQRPDAERPCRHGAYGQPRCRVRGRASRGGRRRPARSQCVLCFRKSIWEAAPSARATAASSLHPLPCASATIVRLALSTSFEIDFWGRLRRLVESARAQALGTYYARDVVTLSLAGLTAQTYFALRSLDAQIFATRETLATRQDYLDIVQRRVDAGLASDLDLNQARGARADASAQLKELVRQRALVEHLLGTLTGKLDLKLPPGDLAQIPVPPVPPAGLPSSLIERRPDIRAAEEDLIAANAQIGVAKAALLPRISLTGNFGGESTELSNLLNPAARIWSIGFCAGGCQYLPPAGCSPKSTRRRRGRSRHWPPTRNRSRPAFAKSPTR